MGERLKNQFQTFYEYLNWPFKLKLIEAWKIEGCFFSVFSEHGEFRTMIQHPAGQRRWVWNSKKIQGFVWFVFFLNTSIHLSRLLPKIFQKQSCSHARDSTFRWTLHAANRNILPTKHTSNRQWLQNLHLRCSISAPPDSHPRTWADGRAPPAPRGALCGARHRPQALLPSLGLLTWSPPRSGWKVALPQRRPTTARPAVGTAPPQAAGTSECSGFFYAGDEDTATPNKFPKRRAASNERRRKKSVLSLCNLAVSVLLLGAEKPQLFWCYIILQARITFSS